MQTNDREKDKKKRKIRNDILLIAALLVFLVLVGLAFRFFRGKGDMVEVTVNGKLYATYSLLQDRTVEICTGEDGKNLLVIKDGKAYIETANCRDGICANHKPIYRQGESIVCLPHKVVITVKRAAAESAPDIVV